MSLSGFHYGSFPQELTDAVIDHLWDDPAALKACSLTSHAFYTRTRIHIFRKMSFGHNFRCDKFVAMCRSSPHIPRVIKHLTLDNRYVPPDEIITFIISSLTSVEWLVMKDVSWVFWVTELVNRGATSFPSLRSLSVDFHDSICYASVSETLTFIQLHPRIRCLELLSVPRLASIDAEYDLPARSSYLESFSISSSAFSSGLSDLMLNPRLSGLSFNRLRIFAISVQDNSDIRFVSTILKTASCTLEEVHLMHQSLRPVLLDDLDISYLRKVTITFSHPIYNERHSSTIKSWGKVFDARAKEVEEIIVRTVVSSPSLFGHMDYGVWSTWDATLSATRSRLRGLVFQVFCTPIQAKSLDMLQQGIEDQFPVLRSRSLFQVEVKSRPDAETFLSLLQP
ncbi:uncharacterized protein EV420DRAFT_1653455 [Desarmillaria tabescens]|uniref:Uncharacterized protein n=1 Tax=Armillaria tabescens TaxID=1929756 RepID=A0AA39MIV5_ARMTA|nr:uncharacterized protein EV420DRAFT_1653455 [Desarmillaria tabescens]KAK0435080.1 hypothetical protein EV420DRAFT_1653455 [Desarmillaria tabescens]